MGDSLGMPFETCHFSARRLADWDGSFQASEFHKLQPGQWTDDTQMATALTGSLLGNGTYSPADAAQRYLTLWTSGELRGAGSATKVALGNLCGGIPWVYSGVESQGNGPAMRIAPLGLFFHNHTESVAAFAELDAGITHCTRESREGSKAVALAVAVLAQRRADRSSLLPRILDWLAPSTVRNRIHDAYRLLGKRPDETLKNLIQMGTGAHVIETVPAAFLAFCGTASFKEAVEVAVQAGGDTDTTAAITGALAGTFYGTEQVDPYLFNPRAVGLEDARKLRELEVGLFDEAPPVYG